MQKDYFLKKLKNLKPKLSAGKIRFWGEFYRRNNYVPMFQDYASNVAIEAYCESFLLKRKSEKRKKFLTSGE
jgi:hypothetical protein